MTVERVSAGNALALIGDFRPGVGVNLASSLPGIVWGGTVPAGSYVIGGDENAFEGFDEQEITLLQEFCLSKFPVTNAQFQCFIDAVDRDSNKWWSGIPEDEKKWDDMKFLFANHPRVNVSWFQAKAFCNWLSDKLGYKLDLPHEYEWEVAARYPDGRFFPWGGELAIDKANIDEGGIGQTTAVGVYPGGKQHALELFDLTGNVWEWCCNKFKKPNESCSGKVQADNGAESRAMRGGAWNDIGDLARSASRDFGLPTNRFEFVGFRVVRRYELKEPEQ